MAGFQTGFSTRLAARLAPADVTATLATVPTPTSGRMLLVNGNITEWISYTGVSGSTITGLTRNLSTTADPSTGGTGLDWGAGTQILMVAMHDQIVDKETALPIVSYTTTQRDALDMTQDYFTGSYPIIYNTTAGQYQYYNGSAWASFATGTVADATNLIGGKVKVSTADTGNTPTVLNSTDDKYAALAGTSGTPSSSNKYVTNDDTATAATASKVARRLAGGNITVVTESPGDNTTNAASTAFVTAAIALLPVTFTNGDTTKNAADASATQTIAHGLGRLPKKVKISMSTNVAGHFAISSYNGTTQSSQCCYLDNNVFTNSNVLRINTNTAASTNYTTGVITFDATNIYIAWTKTNSASGTYQLLWEAN